MTAEAADTGLGKLAQQLDDEVKRARKTGDIAAILAATGPAIDRLEAAMAAAPETREDQRRTALRLFVDAVLYRYRAGIPWRDLPERFGDPIAIHTRFNRWAKLVSGSGGYRAQFQRLKARGGARKAICAVAASMLTAILPHAERRNRKRLSRRGSL